MTNKFAQTPFRIAMNAGDPELKVRGGEKVLWCHTAAKFRKKCMTHLIILDLKDFKTETEPITIKKYNSIV